MTTTINWKPASEAPTERWDRNPAISPNYMVLCEGSDDGNPIIGYTFYSYVTDEWVQAWRTTCRMSNFCHKVLYWTEDKINL